MSFHALKQFQPKTIGLLGDLILDRYTFGEARRVSPEAPVPVLSVTKEEKKAGGVGNVALNLKSLGMNVKLMARVGDDAAGEELCSLLKESGIECASVLVDSSYVTSVKNRFIASSQQLLRVDNEMVTMMTEASEKVFLSSLDEWLLDIDIVAISDYAKGFLTEKVLQEVIQRSNAQGKKVIVDPKGADFRKYRGAHIIKPNYHEALMAVPQSERELEKAVQWIHREVSIPHVMVTRSADGISLFSQGEGLRHFPVAKREVRDCTGAGDTVLACLSASLASGISLEDAISLANTYASIGIERVGCAVISLHDLTIRLLDQNPTGKTISWQAFERAQAAFHQMELCFFLLPDSSTFQTDMLKSLMTKASLLPESTVAVAVFQEENPDKHILELLSGFESINWIVWGASHAQVMSQFPAATFV